MTRPEAPARPPAGPPAGRYGRRDAATTRRHTLVGGVIFVLLVTVWAVWAGLRQANPEVRWRGGAFTTVDDGRASLEVFVTMDPGRTAVCTVRMLNSGLTEVGRLDAVIGPSTERTVRSVVTVPTFEKADGGNVRACAVR